MNVKTISCESGCRDLACGQRPAKVTIVHLYDVVGGEKLLFGRFFSELGAPSSDQNEPPLASPSSPPKVLFEGSEIPMD